MVEFANKDALSKTKYSNLKLINVSVLTDWPELLVDAKCAKMEWLTRELKHAQLDAIDPIRFWLEAFALAQQVSVLTRLEIVWTAPPSQDTTLYQDTALLVPPIWSILVEHADAQSEKDSSDHDVWKCAGVTNSPIQMEIAILVPSMRKLEQEVVNVEMDSKESDNCAKWSAPWEKCSLVDCVQHVCKAQSTTSDSEPVSVPLDII